VRVESRFRPIIELISNGWWRTVRPLRSSRMSGPRPGGPLRAPLHRIDARSRLRVANSVRAQDPHPRSPHGTGWGWGASVGVDRAHSRVRAIILITLNRLNSPRPPGGLGISDVTIRATGREHRFRRRGVFRGCLTPGRPSSNIGRTKRRTGGRTMREIGLVLLSIAMMALLRTDADASAGRARKGARRRGLNCCNVVSPGSNLEVHVKTALTEMFGPSYRAACTMSVLPNSPLWFPVVSASSLD
jgi:hypothetical protein